MRFEYPAVVLGIFLLKDLRDGATKGHRAGMKILLVLAVIFSSLAFWGQRLFLVLGLEPAGIALPVGKAISLLLGAGCLSFAWRMELRELRRSFFPQAPQKELLILMIATALVLFFALFAAGELLDQLVTGPVR